MTTADRWADPRAVTTADHWAEMTAGHSVAMSVATSVEHSAG